MTGDRVESGFGINERDAMKQPTNTTREVNRDPMGFLAEALIGGSSNAIERQEKFGQQELVGSDTLPTKMDDADKTALEAAGVTFLGEVNGDNLFQYCTLPAGWRKRPTDHAMWSRLVDDKGRDRAEIFYKAAFYDRDAFIRLCCRYSARFDYDRSDKERVAVCNVLDGDKVIYTTPPVPLIAARAAEETMEDYNLREGARRAGCAWLDANYPDWKSAAAYWD